MKLRNIFLSILACFALISCNDEFNIPTISELDLSNTFVSIAKEGGSTSITLKATESWAFDAAKLAENDWITIAPTSGAAGEFTITFSAEATEKTRKISDLAITVAGKVQYINVEQSVGIVPISDATCADVIAGADGKTYRVKGKVTSIANTQYGNWYLADETGEIYIYGTLDKNGAEKNFLSLGIEVGDIVTIEGPKTTYGTTIELVNVTVIKIEKSLISAVDKEVSAEKDGGIVDIKLICKSAGGVNFNIPDEVKSWLNVLAVSPLEDTTVVSLNVAPNEGGDRVTTLEFTTTSGGKVYSTQVTLSQAGAIIEATIAEFIASAEDATQYRLSGVITSVANSTYGNIYIKDATGEVYIYGVLDAEGNSKNWSSLGINEGDIVTLTTIHTSYKGTHQGKNAIVDNHIPVKAATVAEFLGAAEDDTYYRLVGKAGSFKDGDAYGNFNISDESGEVYVYGLLSGWGGAKKQFQTLLTETGLKPDDLVTIVGKRTAYKGTPQVGSAFYVSHIPADN